MLIHQLQLENFKSYNGRHVLGPFDPHFTCVIGPNGNGKSNIIDAVLFVFGFKSAKLRQDSLAALIHRSAFAKPDQASVTVTFREGDILTSVSRSVLKSGNSSYRLNGERIGWAELREKLVSKCIDLNKNLFIILQGQVERLCQLSPQKMVEYLEYVSGSDEFKETIEEAERKYVERSIVKEQLRASMAVRKKVFENAKERAGKQTTWMLLRIKGLLLQHLVMKKIFMDNHKNYQEMKAAEEEQVKACMQIEKDMRQKEDLLKEKRSQFKLVAAECRKGQDYIQQVDQKRENVGLKVKEANRQITFAIKDKDNKQQERDRLKAQVDELAQIEKQHAQLQAKCKQIGGHLRGVKQVGKLKICMELEQKIKNAQKQESSLSSKCSEDRKSLLADREKLAIYQLKYRQNKQTIIRCRTQIKSAQDELAQVTTALTQNEQLLQQIERQLSQKPNQKIATILQKLLNQIRTANKMKLICTEVNLVTLRELLIIDSAYADVVQTILPHLDYFIVDNIKQAREVIEYLNKRKLGRMTLLIRESIREATKDLKPATSCPKETKLLYQVCKCTDQQTKNILIWCLGNTLVTSKLDIAMKVAYYDEKRYRVITTNGQFIDSSGTITKLPLKNGKEREDQEFLQKKQITIKRVIASLKEKKVELEEKKQDAQRVLLTVQNEQRSLDGLDQIFLKELQTQLKENTQQLNKVKRQITSMSETLSNLQKKLKEAGFKMKDYNATLLLLKDQAQYEDKIKKIANCHTIAMNLNNKIKQVDTCVTKLNNALQEKVKNKTVLENDKLRLTELIQTKRRELSVIQYGMNHIEGEIKEIQAERRSLDEQLSDSNKKGILPQPREELKKIRGRIRAVEMEKLEMLSKLQQSIRQIKDFSFIICKTLSKCSELVPSVVPQQPSEVPSEQKKQLDIHSLLDQTALVLGKTQYKFTTFLNEKQTKLLFQDVKQNASLYSEISDIRPSDPEGELIFQSIATKDVKFGHSFEMEKLKHFEKEMHRGEIKQFDLDFQLFEEYIEKRRELEAQSERLKEVSKDVEGLKGELIELRNKRLEVFLRCFNDINVELNKIYMGLTGGKAEMSLLDSMNPFQGVQFSVRPINKSWKRVNLLSGGEKTFTSLALIFACEEIKQFPFYFMDEIDAALDYRNTTLLAQYITGKKGTQHIVISLRKNMYQECNRLVGVYKVKDQSRTVELPMAELQSREGEDQNQYEQ